MFACRLRVFAITTNAPGSTGQVSLRADLDRSSLTFTPMEDEDDAQQQIGEALAAERESLSLECRADPARLERLLAPDFHEFGASGEEFGFAGTAALVAAGTKPDDEPITVEHMRAWLLADGLV